MDANPSSHVPLWAAYFERKYQEHEVVHYYLAQIAAEVRRSRVKRPQAVKLDHFLIKFVSKGAGGGATHGDGIKTAFLAALGLRPDGTRIHRTVQRRARVPIPREVQERTRMQEHRTRRARPNQRKG